MSTGTASPGLSHPRDTLVLHQERPVTCGSGNLGRTPKVPTTIRWDAAPRGQPRSGPVIDPALRRAVVSVPEKGTDMVHLIQARQAFLIDRANTVFYALTGSESGWVDLECSDGTVERWEAADAQRLAAIVGRSDLTRRQGRPLVVGNAAKGLLGFAAGPPAASDDVHILVVLHMSRLVLAAAAADQPEWWLVDANLTGGSV